MISAHTRSLATILLFIFFAYQSYSQCGNTGNKLQDYTILSHQESVSSSIIDEISGMAYNDDTDEIYVVSDDGKLARRKTNGTWQAIEITDWSGNNCHTSRFGDIEGISYMGKTGTNKFSYAIAEERERFITFITLTSTQTSLSYPINSYLKFTDMSFTAPQCGGNDGIEGLAYHAETNKMYFLKERNDQSIYSFTVPSSINGQTISPNHLIDLASIPNMNTYAIHGMDMLANGNLIVLAAEQGISNVDPGLYNRMILEFDTCGDLISKADLEPTIPNSAELEGIAVVENSIYVIGEFGIMYQLDKSPIASVFPDLFLNQQGLLSQSGAIATHSNIGVINQGSDDALPYSIGAYLSTDNVIDYSDSRIGTAAVISGHSIGQQQIFNYSFDVNSFGLSLGSYYVGYIVDEFDTNLESDETNNTTAIQSATINVRINNCQNSLTINSNPIPENNYFSRVSIYSNGMVDGTSEVNFSTGNHVELSQGFEIKRKGKFHAFIGGCQ